MKDQRVSQIVAQAMSTLSRDLVLKCCQEDWFVPAVRDDDGKPITIIDTEKRPIQDYQTFCNESLESYKQLYGGGFGWKI